MNIVREAVSLAFLAHKGQYRKYGDQVDYVQHPMRVALKVATMTGDDIVLTAAAVLHDVLEDTTISPETISETCGPDVLELVKELTNPSKLPEHANKPRAERKRIDREHLKHVSYFAKIIKLCDRIDNLHDLKNAPEDFKKLYATESFDLLNHSLRGVNFRLEQELSDAIEELLE